MRSGRNGPPRVGRKGRTLLRVAPYVVWTLGAAVALLVAEWRGFRPGVWVAKPLAASGFVAAALALRAPATPYGRWVLAALVLCWLGDVLLIARGRASVFRAGIASFLLGHVAFALAFVERGVALALTLAALACALLPLVGVARWLRPHVPAGFRAPVGAYMVIISVMVACAVGTVSAAGGTTVLAGALLFYASDLAVARDRFVAPGFVNRLWGLPLYFAAQLVLASTVASAGV